MPKIRRKHVPPVVIEHLAKRVRERAVPIADLQALAKWLDGNPTVPDDPGFKRFAPFVVCGEGELVKTILEEAHTAVGTEME